MKKVLLGSVIAAVMMSGCGFKSNVMISQNGYDAIEENEVAILMNDKPQCDYEIVAAVTIDQLVGQANAIEAARKEAASLGADYVSINFISTYSDDDVSVAGIAYRCVREGGAVEENTQEEIVQEQAEQAQEELQEATE